MDIVSRVEHFPARGETIAARDTVFILGGKGANQATAAVRCGAAVRMIGAVGDDVFGQALAASLHNDGIDISGLVVKQGVTSGCAIITVDELGQNSIVVSSGANGNLEESDLQAEYFKGFDVLLLQNEVPWSVTKRALQSAKERGMTILYNPSPVIFVDSVRAILSQIDYLFVNEHEAASLSGCHVSSPQSAAQVATVLRKLGARAVVVTLGDQGAVLQTEHAQTYHVPAQCVNVVDTTAAGDTMIGAFVARHLAGHSMLDALVWASAAAALCVSRSGAQSSIPTFAQITTFLSQTSAPPVQLI